jgi:hypothetical protein
MRRRRFALVGAEPKPKTTASLQPCGERARKIGVPANGAEGGAQEPSEKSVSRTDFSEMPQHAMMRTLGRIAALATAAGPLDVRAGSMLRELRAGVPFDSAMLCRIDVATRCPAPVVVEGYPAHVATQLCNTDLSQAGVRRRVVIEADPAGPSLLCPLTSADGRAVGLLALGPAPDVALAFIDPVAPVLASVVDPVQTAARLAAILSEHEPSCLIVASTVHEVFHARVRPTGLALWRTSSPSPGR